MVVCHSLDCLRFSQPQPYWHLGSHNSQLGMGWWSGPLHCRVFASLPSSHWLHAGSSHTHTHTHTYLSCDNERCLQTLPNIPWDEIGQTTELSNEQNISGDKKKCFSFPWHLIFIINSFFLINNKTWHRKLFVWEGTVKVTSSITTEHHLFRFHHLLVLQIYWEIRRSFVYLWNLGIYFLIARDKAVWCFCFALV